MASYITKPDPKGRGGVWHIWPNGRQVYVKPGGGGGGGGGSNAATGVSYDMGGAPVDYAAQQTQAAARQNIALGEAGDVYQRQQLSNEYGLGGDTSNPYSRAMMLQANYKKSQAANTGSYAQKGQLYSGALQTAQQAATSGYNQSYDQLQRQYQKQLNQIAQNRLQRYATQGQTMDDATYQSIQRGLTGLGA